MQKLLFAHSALCENSSNKITDVTSCDQNRSRLLGFINGIESSVTVLDETINFTRGANEHLARHRLRNKCTSRGFYENYQSLCDLLDVQHRQISLASPASKGIQRELIDHQVLCEEQYPDQPCNVEEVNGEFVGVPHGIKDEGFGGQLMSFAPDIYSGIAGIAGAHGQSSNVDMMINVGQFQADAFTSTVNACNSLGGAFIGSAGSLGMSSFGHGFMPLAAPFSGGFCHSFTTTPAFTMSNAGATVPGGF